MRFSSFVFAVALSAWLASPVPGGTPALVSQEVPVVPDELKSQTLFVSVRADFGSGTWSADSIRQTMSGTPVVAKITGSNLAITVQITAYITPERKILVVMQAETLLMKDDAIVNRAVAMNTMTVVSGERVAFYPLGTGTPGGKPPLKLEIMVEDYETFMKRSTAPGKAP